MAARGNRDLMSRSDAFSSNRFKAGARSVSGKKDSTQHYTKDLSAVKYGLTDARGAPLTTNIREFAEKVKKLLFCIQKYKRVWPPKSYESILQAQILDFDIKNVWNV